MTLNLTTFFAYVRKAPFGGRLTQEQKDGVTTILAAWEANSPANVDPRHLAYILATAFHETDGRMQPVREGFAKSDMEARRILAKRPYARPDKSTGLSYYGRGFAQLTWASNYKKMGLRIGEDLLKNPDLALQPGIAAKILVVGMVEGLFTGKKLRDSFNSTVDAPKLARTVVNGADKADLIAGYHAAFLGALKAADEATPQPIDVKPQDAEADAPALTTDKTTLGTVTAVISAGGAGILGAIDNPWALVALFVVGVGALLFITGRLEIRHKAGA